MPLPNEVHVDAALTNISVAFGNSDYIASDIAPAVPVAKQSDRYFVYDSDREWMRPSDDLRAPGTEASELDYNLSTDAYYCRDHALESAIPDEERFNSDAPVTCDIDRTEFLTEKILLNQEMQLAGILASDALPGITATEDSKWSDPAFDPLTMIAAGHEAVMSGIQRRANVLLAGQDVFDALLNHPKVVERFKYTSGASIDDQALARLLHVDRVVVGRAWKNVSRRGQAPSMAAVWSRDAFLLHVNPRPGLRSIGALSTFCWTRCATGTRGAGYVVERWREDRRKADMIRVQKYYDIKLVAPRALYRMSNLL